MNEEKELLREIREAQKNSRNADRFLEKYTPFIRSEAMKYTGYANSPARDDAFSVALFAFYEALMNYDDRKGAFFPLAKTYIRNRIIDSFRSSKNEDSSLSLDDEIHDDSDRTLLDNIVDEKSSVEYQSERECTREEIEEFEKTLSSYGLTFSDIAENAPRQARTMDTCIAALSFARRNPDIFTYLTEKGKLPLSRIVKEGGFDRKTLERHRKYLVGLFLAFTNGFIIIRGHLSRLKEGFYD